MQHTKIEFFVMALLMSIVSKCSLPELPIAVVIASYNNNRLFQGRLLYEQNLESITQQKYSNYRIIYVDDCSTDGTADAVEQYLYDHGFGDKCTIIRNTRRWGPSRNRYVGAHWCNDDEIVCILDGDDFFADDTVLQRVNQTYNRLGIWVTYSQFKTVPDNTFSGGKPTPQSVIDTHSYREFGWYYHSLKTFYAWLFKNIKLQDLLHEGYFFTAASDLAEMFPLIEMSAGRFAYIPDLLYLASQHPHNEMHTQGREFMAKMGDVILKQLKPYPPFEQMSSVSVCSPEDIPIYVDHMLSMYEGEENDGNVPYSVVVRLLSDVNRYQRNVLPLMPAIIKALHSTGAYCAHLFEYGADAACDQMLDISGVGFLSPLYARISTKKKTHDTPLPAIWCTIYAIAETQLQSASDIRIELLLPVL